MNRSRIQADDLEFTTEGSSIEDPEDRDMDERMNRMKFYSFTLY